MNDNLAYELEFYDELIDGEIVMMSPRPATNHNQTAFNIAAIFKTFLKGKTCRVFPDGMDLYLTEKDRFVPDVMVICDRSKIKNDGVHGAPDLVVEVLSPTSIKRDRVYKKRIYEQCGVREYWLVDTVNQSVEVYLLKDKKFVLDEVYQVFPDYVELSEKERAEYKSEVPVSLYEDFSIPLEDIFRNLF